MSIICIFVFFGLIMLNTILMKKLVNYLNVFVLLWLVSVFFSSLGIFGFKIPSNRTYLYILITVFVFDIFSLFFNKIKTKSSKNFDRTINTKILLIISIVLTISIIPETLQGLEIIKHNGFNYLRNYYLNGLLYTNLQKLYLTYIVRPLNLAVFIFAIQSVITKKNGKIPLLMCLINFIQLILIFGSRSFIFEILIITFVLIFERYKNIFQIMKKNKKIVILIITMIIILLYITIQRNISKSGGILVNIYAYFIGGIHLFDYLRLHPEISNLDSGNLLYGYAFFNGILEPFKILLNYIFHLDIRSGIEIINDITQKYYLVAPDIYMNNNVTWMYIFLRDLDVLGLFVFPIIVALFYSHYYKKRNADLLYKSIYYYIISIMPYFLFEFRLALCSSFLTIIYLILLYKMFKKENINGN